PLAIVGYVLSSADPFLGAADGRRACVCAYVRETGCLRQKSDCRSDLVSDFNCRRSEHIGPGSYPRRGLRTEQGIALSGMVGFVADDGGHVADLSRSVRMGQSPAACESGFR